MSDAHRLKEDRTFFDVTRRARDRVLGPRSWKEERRGKEKGSKEGRKGKVVSRCCLRSLGITDVRGKEKEGEGR